MIKKVNEMICERCNQQMRLLGSILERKLERKKKKVKTIYVYVCDKCKTEKEVEI
ncbi:hypothetical protein [Methanoculleus sp.]|jgi:predicted nucleic acid-binding Zn ribbon protein|uniref:hypothetical protein n=1 Tax=Methanoculleus sp. TaxID=90427 RepID=UPI0025F53889|nr:hypothetical protein [Methanoculleus sp.]MCK9320091.1 hypothetical protein [Methanoculleus sp.]